MAIVGFDGQIINLSQVREVRCVGAGGTFQIFADSLLIKELDTRQAADAYMLSVLAKMH